MWFEIRAAENLHNTQTEEDNQTDLYAQFEIQVPEHHCREHRQKQIGGGIECVRIVREVDHSSQIAAGC